MNEHIHSMLMMDKDDYLNKIKFLTAKKDSLQEMLELEEQRISIWNFILSCSSAEELKSINLDATEVEDFSVDVWKDVTGWQELSTSLQAYNILGVQVMDVNDGLLVEFSPHCNYVSEREPKMFLEKEKSNRYRVKYADLVNDVPLEELEELYLDTEDERGLVRFFHSVNRYEQSFFLRMKQLEEIKMFIDSETLDIYFNKHLTVVALTLKLEIDGDTSVVELRLLYRPLDDRPHEATYHHQSGVKLTVDVQTKLEEIKNSFNEKDLVDVFRVFFSTSDQESDSGDSGESSSTIEFGI